MIHPWTELAFVSPDVGWGVFATRRIPRGTITWLHDPEDRRFPPDQVHLLTEQDRRHCFQDRLGNWVLAADHARSVNHSCDPNCVSGGEDGFEVAIRDIGPGEQLTDDYGEMSGFAPFTCSCGSSLCRATVVPRSPSAFTSRFRRRQMRDALARAPQVDQPLLRLVPGPIDVPVLATLLAGLPTA